MAKNVHKLPSPRPVAINEVCSECGEAWSLHPADATLADCVRILKQKPSTTIVMGSSCSCHCHHLGLIPWIPPLPRPYPIWVSNGTETVTTTDAPYPQLPYPLTSSVT